MEISLNPPRLQAPTLTESELVNEFTAELRARSIRFRLEVMTRCGRPDVLVCAPDDSGVVCAVEAKRAANLLKPAQLLGYSWLDIPLFTLCDLSEVYRRAGMILREMPEFYVAPWDYVLPDGRMSRAEFYANRKTVAQLANK